MAQSKPAVTAVGVGLVGCGSHCKRSMRLLVVVVVIGLSNGKGADESAIHVVCLIVLDISCDGSLSSTSMRASFSFSCACALATFASSL